MFVSAVNTSILTSSPTGKKTQAFQAIFSQRSTNNNSILSDNVCSLIKLIEDTPIVMTEDGKEKIRHGARNLCIKEEIHD